jgi:hypothetical protein
MDPDLHFIFGSILKRMRYRPTVLDEFVDEENIEEDTKTNGYSLTDDEDLFEFEDDQQVSNLLQSGTPTFKYPYFCRL